MQEPCPPEIPHSHKFCVDLLDTMRKYTNQHEEDMMGMMTMRQLDQSFVVTLGSYRTGDAFFWFVDRTDYFLYVLVNESEGVRQILKYPIERQNEFAQALKEVQREFQERGNPVTIRRPI